MPLAWMNDPTAALLYRCAEGTADPYFEQLRAELAGANRDNPWGVSVGSAAAAAHRVPSLTPRR